MEKIEYCTLNDLQENDIKICEELETFGTSTPIDDAIHEIASGWAETNSKELFKIGYELYKDGYTDEALSECIENSEDIISVLTSAHICYIRRLLYYNLEDIIKNIAINYIEDNALSITEDEVENDITIDKNSYRYVNEIESTIDDFLYDKVNEILEDFDKDDFVSSALDEIFTDISEVESSIAYDIHGSLSKKLLEDNNINYEDVEFCKLEEEYSEITDYVSEFLMDRVNESEYFSRLDICNNLIVYNSPSRLLTILDKEIANNTYTVEDLDNLIITEIKKEYEMDEDYNYSSSIYEGESDDYIFNNQSYSYHLGGEIYLNVSWNILTENKDDIFATTVKVTSIELI